MNLLELYFRVKSAIFFCDKESYGKLYKFENIGDVILHFRNNYLVKIVAFAHECADNGISLESTISKLGLVA